MSEWGHYFKVVGIEPTPFIKKMMQMIQNDGRFDGADYARYESAMEAICSRKPERMSENGLEMLKKKVSGIACDELRAHARAEYEELEAKVNGTWKPARRDGPMNKKEAEKMLRKVAWDVCMLGNNGNPDDIEALEENGYVFRRDTFGGMDGISVSKDHHAEWYIAVPRKRNPGKKQTCTKYTYKDALHFHKADGYLADGDVDSCMAYMKDIESASLLAELNEGLDRLYQEQMEKKAEEPEQAPEPEPAQDPEPMSDVDAIRAILAGVGEFEITQKKPGCCVFVKGDTKEHKDLLKSFGLRWAPKKEAWYWKPCAA